MKPLVVGILAHVDAGKTTLAEAILYSCGKIRTLGRVDHRDTFFDTHSIERARGITVFSKEATFESEHRSITLVDTPGHVDFSAETERTLAVLDLCILVISGTDGVQAHTETLLRLLRRYRVPTFLFFTKMDAAAKERAELLREVKKLEPCCIDFAAETSEEEIALLDEALLERYLETGRVSAEEIKALICSRRLLPCLFGSGMKLDGVRELIEAIDRFAPEPEYPERFSARVYKITHDEKGARMTHLKVTGGSLKIRDTVEYRTASGVIQEKVTGIRRCLSDRFEMLTEVRAGELCAVLGLQTTAAGMSLGESEHALTPLLEPVLNYRILLPPDKDPRAVLRFFRELEEEDPMLHIGWDDAHAEISAELMGEVQAEVLIGTMRDRFGLEIGLDEGRILYKETIAAPVHGAGHYEPLRHYAEVHLLLEPLPRGHGLVFDSSCRTDRLDLNWQRLILTHLKEKIHRGVLTGAPITDLRISLVAGRAHLKHTEGGDFRQATYRAVRHGLMQAESILLEPFYRYRLRVPAAQIGRAAGDLRLRCGTVELGEETEGMREITGEAPVSTMRGYGIEVKAYTGGRGMLSLMLCGYRPCHNTAKVVEASGYHPEEDLANTPDSVFCFRGAGETVKWQDALGRMHLQPELPGFTKKTAESSVAAGRLDDKELEAIMLRTYGPIKRPKYGSVSGEVKTSDWESAAPKPEILILDGYNVIFAWEELDEITKTDLDAARSRLVDLLEDYRGSHPCEITVVFDAYRVAGGTGSEHEHGGVRVVYTKEGETGDLYIEKMIRETPRDSRIRVITSDSMIQISALRAGVLRVPVREFRAEVLQQRARTEEAMALLKRRGTFERGAWMNPEMREKLIRSLEEEGGFDGEH